MINEKRVRSLYRLMDIRTIYRKRNLSKANLADYKYPYLLRGLVIDPPNQVWQADINIFLCIEDVCVCYN